MSDDRKLKEGWRWVRFGDVVRDVRDTTKDPAGDGLTCVVGLDHLDPESLPLRRWDELDDLPDGTSFTRVFRAGQVLFGKRRAYQRKVAVADFDGVCSSDILVFEPSTDELLPEFLPYLVQSDGFFDHALGTSAGSLSPRTKFKELAKYKLGLPPGSEQHAIVAALEVAQDTAAAFEEVGSMGAKLARAIVWDLEETASAWTTLGEVLVGTLRNGLTVQPRDECTGAWALTVGSASETGYSADGTRAIEVPIDAHQFKAEVGDLFVTRSNTIERVGLPLTVPAGVPGDLYYSDLLMRVRPDERVMPAELLEHILRGPRARAFIRSIAAGTSASMKKINARNLSRLPIPLASPERIQVALDRLRALELLLAQNERTGSGLGMVARRLREHLMDGSAA